MEYVEYEIHFRNGQSHRFVVELGEKDTYKYKFESSVHINNKNALTKAISNNLNGELELRTTVGLVKIRVNDVQMFIINGLE